MKWFTFIVVQIAIVKNDLSSEIWKLFSCFKIESSMKDGTKNSVIVGAIIFVKGVTNQRG